MNYSLTFNSFLFHSFFFACVFLKAHPDGQMVSLCSTQIWCILRPQSRHSTSLWTDSQEKPADTIISSKDNTVDIKDWCTAQLVQLGTSCANAQTRFVKFCAKILKNKNKKPQQILCFITYRITSTKCANSKWNNCFICRTTRGRVCHSSFVETGLCWWTCEKYQKVNFTKSNEGPKISSILS